MILRNTEPYNLVLILVVEMVAKYQSKAYPSPTIEELSNHTGYSQETILESMEFGNIEPVSILQ